MMLKQSKMVKIKHEMDKEYREISLNEAFKEALLLSEGGSSEQEEFETKLLRAIEINPALLERFEDEYKLNTIKSWDYDVEILV